VFLEIKDFHVRSYAMRVTFDPLLQTFGDSRLNLASVGNTCSTLDVWGPFFKLRAVSFSFLPV